MATFLDNNLGSNNGWKYYKQYYDLNAGTTIQTLNQSLCNTILLEIPALIPDRKSIFTEITTYPGLVIGTGYSHNKKGR